MPIKKVPFTDAREALAALIDEVQESGRPIAITRRGKPAVVIMNLEGLEQKLGAPRKGPWMLRGSGTWQGPADIDSTLRNIRKRAGTARKTRIEKLLKSMPVR